MDCDLTQRGSIARKMVVVHGNRPGKVQKQKPVAETILETKNEKLRDAEIFPTTKMWENSPVLPDFAEMRKLREKRPFFKTRAGRS